MHSKNSLKKASNDFLSKKKYELFRKQFKLLHVREDFIEIFTVGDEEEEIVIIDDEEDEVVIMKEEEEEDDIIILEEDEEKKDE